MPNSQLRYTLWALPVTLLAGPALSQGQQDFSQVQIKVHKVAGSVHYLEGQGGNVGLLVGDDGVLMIDDQFAPLSEKLTAAIKTLSQKPIRMLINTHVHGDHTGGNENFGKMGAVIMARPLLRARLMKPAPGANGQTPPSAPAAALPVVTYDQPLTLQFDGEEVRIVPLPPSHTDGDTAVKFVTADVLATGDVFRSIGFPNIDRTNGGTLKGLIESMDTFISLAGPNTKVVPGHGDVTNRAGLVAHKEVIITVRDRVAKGIQEGKTVEQIVASKPTADLDQKVGLASTSADRFVQQLYAELRGGR
jgi:glyoxylase-like metal-dependent hydrolase (beta-lactamase superfamily II)